MPGPGEYNIDETFKNINTKTSVKMSGEKRQFFSKIRQHLTEVPSPLKYRP